MKLDFPTALSSANEVLSFNNQHDGALYLKSKILFDQGDFLESSHFLIKAGEADPNNPYLASEIAYMYSTLGQYNKAAETYEALIKKYPFETMNYYGAFENYLKAKNYKAAEKIIIIQEKQFGNTIETVLNLYSTKIDQKDYKRAIQILETGLESFPDEPQLLANLVDLYFQQNDQDKAIPMLEKLCKADPNNGLAKYIYGDYLINIGKADDGEALWAEAVLLEGLNSAQKSEILNLFQKKHACAESNRTLFQSYVQNYPNEISGRTVLGNFYYTCNDPENAAIQYKEALRIRPEEYSIWKQLLIIHFKEEQWDSLNLLSSECISLFPVQPLPQLTLAAALNKKGMFTDAKEAIEAGQALLLENDPMISAEFLLQSGILSIGENNFKFAKTCFLKALSLQPNNLEMIAEIAKEALSAPAIFQFGDSLLTSGLAQEPNNPTLIATKAHAYILTNEIPLARIWIEKATINGYPSFKSEELLGDCALKIGDKESAKLYFMNAISKGNHSDRIFKKLQTL